MADEKLTVIDAQADIEGRLKGKDAVIHGRFKGEIALAGRLVIAEGSKVEATVTADAVEVAGELKGDLRSRALTLAEKARVQGTIDARVLVVREGAWLSGSVTAGEQKPAPPAHAPAAHAPAEKPAPQQAPAPEKADKGA